MSLDFSKLADEAQGQDQFSVGGNGGPAVPQGEYDVKVVEVKSEKSFNGFAQVHLVCEITAVHEITKLEERDESPAIGTRFTAKFNVDTSDNKKAQAAEGNVKQLFALAIWNGLPATTFNQTKLQRDFGNEYSYHMTDKITETGIVCRVSRQRGKPAQKGYYWNHGLAKINSAVKPAASAAIPQADDEDLA